MLIEIKKIIVAQASSHVKGDRLSSGHVFIN